MQEWEISDSEHNTLEREEEENIVDDECPTSDIKSIVPWVKTLEEFGSLR